ncbi:GDSL-type esterase/lipase family protein [Porphyromonas crevioricanis]|uniref:SGNH hydrolase-type esterase domain-containing protein n=2 Tax=Porphyromonas crevioricanis TaxID=393921 RepID=A0AB34PFB7_9PORP|nr:GDSL-type esterase/lipase family protein [Porphyromonas crevioricanis]KGN94143.1 hypothetical protein HQ38_06295 [Porphyromonas crevioricanis]SJZ67073.1 Lysophospholipase L1 [Porphyromonas crevioricanis]
MMLSNRWKLIISCLLVGLLALPECWLRLWAGRSEAAMLSDDTTTRLDIGASRNQAFVLVHIGDSHVQAGHMSGLLRKELQQRFGSAGRGWISPYKLYGSNQPTDYSVQASPSRWHYKLITQQNRTPQAVGPSGILLRPAAQNFNLSLSLKNTEQFDRVYVHRSYHATPLKPGSNTGYTLLPSQQRSDMVVDTLLLDIPTSSLRLIPNSTVVFGEDTGYSGFVLELTETKKRKIFYHEIGLNGAVMDQYASDVYMQGLASLRPNIVLVSLGTNECTGRNFNEEVYLSSLDRLVTLLQEYCPQAQIVFTTPPPFFRTTRLKAGSKRVRRGRGKKARYRRVPVYRTQVEPNDNTLKAAKAMRSYCQERGIVCIDLHEMMGGNDGALRWTEEGLYGADKVHFTVEGYQRQGRLILKELEPVVEKAMQGKNKSLSEKD